MNQNRPEKPASRRSLLKGAAAVGGLGLSGLAAPATAQPPGTLTGVGRYASIGQETAAPLRIALEGRQILGDGDLYLGPVRVAVAGASEAASVEYAVDGGPWSGYDKPFILGAAGRHEVVARVTGGSDEVSDSVSRTFQINVDETSLVTIGIIADTHARPTRRASIPAWPNQLPEYERFTTSMNREVRPDFVVQLGDLNDGCVYPAPGECRSRGREPVYTQDDVLGWIGMAKGALHEKLDALTLDVLGNHEYHEPQLWDEKRTLAAINTHWSKTSDTWYSFSYKQMTFIVLNTAFTDAVPEQHSAPIEEIEWLRATLAATSEPTFVFMHVPASYGCNEPYDQFINQGLVSQALAGHEHFVAGFFGHVHHCRSWHRHATQIDDYGNRFYHVTFPHDWMGDPSQTPWGVVELDLAKNLLVFRAGTGVDNPAGHRTRWERPIIRGPLVGNHYLSDLEWSHASNRFGPTELDLSNGGGRGLDGSPLTLNGEVYAKGLGVHAPSEIVYQLGGYRGRFLSDIGIDDEPAAQGSVTFEVWVDGERAYHSGVITADTQTRTVDVDLSGAQELRLVVTDAGDGNTGDHADWAGARLHSGSTGG